MNSEPAHPDVSFGAQRRFRKAPAQPWIYLDRVLLSGLSSELIPASIRTKIMRNLGFDLAPTACLWSGCNLRSRKMRVGDKVFINTGFYFDGADWLTVGANVRIGPFVRIITATHNIGPPSQRCEIEAHTAPINIGSGSWIGANATIMPGVTIGDGCIVGANSLLSNNMEPNSLYAGTPARFIKLLPVRDNVIESQ